ncbi:MAG TPA: magnesium/cobalt efflux protein, partial [Idiomarina sp.]|nr:magnesium/cobalt efflux protein [Idiomarina sp.]
RNEVIGIDINDDISRITKQIEQAQHTLLVLYRNDIDDAIGFLHARDVMRLMSKNR